MSLFIGYDITILSANLKTFLFGLITAGALLSQMILFMSFAIAFRARCASGGRADVNDRHLHNRFNVDFPQ